MVRADWQTFPRCAPRSAGAASAAVPSLAARGSWPGVDTESQNLFLFLLRPESHSVFTQSWRTGNFENDFMFHSGFKTCHYTSLFHVSLTLKWVMCGLQPLTIIKVLFICLHTQQSPAFWRAHGDIDLLRWDGETRPEARHRSTAQAFTASEGRQCWAALGTVTFVCRVLSGVPKGDRDKDRFLQYT